MGIFIGKFKVKQILAEVDSLEIEETVSYFEKSSQESRPSGEYDEPISFY